MNTAAPVAQSGAAPRPAVEEMVARVLSGLGRESGAALVLEGLEAFAVRARSARSARRTLDLQYYAWANDVTGRLMVREVLAAADRGVRVRLLLDDTCVLADDSWLATLADHRGIEVRLFNATCWRGLGRLGFALEFMLGGWHLNHRMHNKAWIADGSAAVLGGRNIGDAYFDAEGAFAFRDMDVLLLGGAVQQATAVFDRYWTSRQVRPVQAFRRGRRSLGRLAGLRAQLEQRGKEGDAAPYLERLARDAATGSLLADLKLLPLGEVKVLADDPAKGVKRRLGSAITTEILAYLHRARREVVLISPYFVPGFKGSRLLAHMVRRGIKVSIITNSLAATDVTAVHGGYARYRRGLLKAGVVIHELKRSGHENSGVFGSKGASLHTKAIVVDGVLVGVGSFNLDPRSVRLNTEMGVFADQAELAALVRAEYDRLIDPRSSYGVRWTHGRLIWSGIGGDANAVSRGEPDASIKRRIIAFLVRLLPMESQL